jgi:hypothetical protein
MVFFYFLFIFLYFFFSYGGYVVAQVVLMKDEAALRAIAQTLGTDPADLLRANFTRVFASCFPLYYAHPYSDQAPEVCKRIYAEEGLGDEREKRKVDNHRADCEEVRSWRKRQKKLKNAFFRFRA